MPATSSLVKKLATNYPEITFSPGNAAHWSADTQTVYYDLSEPHADWVLLHETSHGLLSHSQYTRDIELVRIERQAWNYAASTLAPKFGIQIDSAFIEAQLDTYRDWLHIKSTCPSCQSNGYESLKHHYACLHCGANWRTNAGVDVGVKRYITT